jgi:hypothetical protein
MEVFGRKGLVTWWDVASPSKPSFFIFLICRREMATWGACYVSAPCMRLSVDEWIESTPIQATVLQLFFSGM